MTLAAATVRRDPRHDRRTPTGPTNRHRPTDRRSSRLRHRPAVPAAPSPTAAPTAARVHPPPPAPIPSYPAAGPGYPPPGQGYPTGRTAYPPAGAGVSAGRGVRVPGRGRRRTRGTNTMAIVSLILSLVGLVTGITAPIGAVLGHMARKQIRETGEEGDGLALAGIIIGWVLTGLFVLACCVVGVIFAVAASSAEIS